MMIEEEGFRKTRGRFLGNEPGSTRANSRPEIRRALRDGAAEATKDLQAMERWAQDGFVSIPNHAVDLRQDQDKEER